MQAAKDSSWFRSNGFMWPLDQLPIDLESDWTGKDPFCPDLKCWKRFNVVESTVVFVLRPLQTQQPLFRANRASKEMETRCNGTKTGLKQDPNENRTEQENEKMKNES